MTFADSPVFDELRARLTDPEFTAKFIDEYPTAAARDAALTQLWGSTEDATIARRQHAWDSVARPATTTAELAIIGANEDIPVDVLLRHPSASHELVRFILDRMKLRETRPPEWERTYWYWVNRSHR